MEWKESNAIDDRQRQKKCSVSIYSKMEAIVSPRNTTSNKRPHLYVGQFFTEIENP